jgi:hypothetical protein
MNDDHPFIDDPQLKRVYEITMQCRGHLRGNEPEIQGAVLADLVATFLAGHAPALRDAAYERLVEWIQPLVQVNEALMFKGKGHPAKGFSFDEPWSEPDGP